LVHPAVKKRSSPASAAASAASPAAAGSFWNSSLLKGVVLFIFVLQLYAPSFRAGFIIDDDRLGASPLFKEGLSGLRDIWFSTRFGDFVPVTATSFWLEWQAYGAPRQIQHATNILLQALNVLLLWRVLLRLAVPGAWLAAAVFAAHPLCVTSVTWLAERKNTLSMFFYLLSLMLYLRSDAPETSALENGRRSNDATPSLRKKWLRCYWLSFGCFLLGLLSKSSVVILPVVFLLCAGWRRKRVDARDLRRAAPFFFVAFAAGTVTLVAHHFLAPQIGISLTTDSLLVRALGAARAVWFYLGKTLLPIGLTLFYARWQTDPASWQSYLPGVTILGLFILFWCYRQSWGRACLFGLGYFMLAVAPTLGVLKMVALNITQMADHFQYLALPGLVALAVGGLCCLLGKVTRRTRWVVPTVILGFVVAPLTVLSWQHQRLIGNAEVLWEQNLKLNPDSWPIHDHLGRLLASSGRFEEALPHLREVVRIRSDEAPPLYNLGQAYLLQGKLGEAIQCFSNAIAIKPDHMLIRTTLAKALAQKGDNAQATFHYTQAHCFQARALLQKDNTAGAIAEWREALKFMPDSTEALASLGWVLATTRNDYLRNGVEALALAERACSVARSQALPPPLNALAAAYAEMGRFAEATNTIQAAMAMAGTTGRTNLAIKYQSQLERYRQGMPWRE
jgi:protein O-mannosyl-transferase